MTTTTPTPPLAPAPDQPVPADYDLLCEHCGYSLIGLTGDRCPECGTAFDPTALPLARVPWLYRSRIGRVSAYVRTVWMILTGPRRFAEEICRPVRISRDDARRFRLVTVRIAVITCVLAAVAGAVIAVREMYSVGVTPPPAFLLTSAILIVWGGFMAMLGLVLATDMPTFIWRGVDRARPDDLGPLHHYAAAPLALAPILAAALVAAVAVAESVFGWDVEDMAVAVVPTALATLFLPLWLIPVTFMRVATGCSWSRALVLLAYLPLHWMLMMSLAFMVFVVPVAFFQGAYDG